MQVLKASLLVKITTNYGLNSFYFLQGKHFIYIITYKHHNKLKKWIVFRDEYAKPQKVGVEKKWLPLAYIWTHKQYWDHKNNAIFLAHLNFYRTFFFLVCRCQSLYQRSYSPDMNNNTLNIKSIMLLLL